MSQRTVTLGKEMRRLREQTGVSLRQFAQKVGVSAPHLSDIERDRRRPSKGVLKRIASELRSVGGTYAGLERLDARFERDLKEWVEATPEVRLLLRKVKDSGRPVVQVVRELERTLRKPGKSA